MAQYEPGALNKLLGLANTADFAKYDSATSLTGTAGLGKCAPNALTCQFALVQGSKDHVSPRNRLLH